MNPQLDIFRRSEDRAGIQALQRQGGTPEGGRATSAIPKCPENPTGGRSLFLALLLAAATVLVGFPGASPADYVTDSFGMKNCSKPGTMSVEAVEDVGTVATFDLSAIPMGTEVYRAILRVSVNRPDARVPVLFYPAVKTGAKLARDKAPLALREPFFQDFDATEAVRKALQQGPKLELIAVVPGWQRDATALEVSYKGKAEGNPPGVSGLEATYKDGQVFIRFKEVEDIIAADQVNLADFEAKLLEARKKRALSYRIYRHSQPITPDNLGQAELVRTIEEVVPAYNLDAIPTTEFPGKDSRPSKLPGLGGNRVTNSPIPRFQLPTEKPLTSGENVCVTTTRKDGSFHYAVAPVVNGYEAVVRLSEANSTPKPIVEKVEAIAPLLQKKSADKQQVLETYVCFYEPPYWPTPLRVEMVSTYNPADTEKGKVPLQICCGIYGGQAPYNLGRRHVAKGVYVAPPVMPAMGQGIHECIGTLKSFDQGVIRNYPQRQILALVEWAKRKWPIDDQRVVLAGQFVLWGLRHGDVFAMVIADPYGNYSAGIEMQKQSNNWSTAGKDFTNEDGGVSQWEYLNIAKWIKQNPGKELPFYCGCPSGATHVGDMGFMDCPETYRSLLDARQPFAARWGHSLGTGGPTAIGFPVGKDMPLPAFSNCSLDDCIGEGDQWGGAGGGTIGSGDPFGQINNFLHWDIDGVVDQPDRFEVTVWLDAGAPRPTCTVDLTPRKCRKFKPKEGDKFAWSAAPAGDKPGRQATADKYGLVTVQGLTVGKDKVTVKIEKK